MLFPGRDESVPSHPAYYFLGQLIDFSASECHCFGLLSWLCCSTGLAFPLVQKWADLPARAVRTRQETMPSFTQVREKKCVGVIAALFPRVHV